MSGDAWERAGGAELSVSRLALDQGLTLAGAESVTAGTVASRLASAPEASAWFRGALVCYATEVKHEVLGVPPGPVISEACVRAMAEQARALLGSDLGYATSGVGGPETLEGHAPGTVWLAVAGPDGTSARVLHVVGEPDDVVRKATDEVLALLLERLEVSSPARGA